MFGLSNNVRYFMCQHPVNMRKGINSLFNLIISESPMAPMTYSCSRRRSHEESWCFGATRRALLRRVSMVYSRKFYKL